MKKISKLCACALFIIFLTTAGNAQSVGGADELYVKSNIALTRFKILGVNVKQYARCAESVNFESEEKKLRYTVIDKAEFADDGKNYDLVANDGIMTSKVLFAYSSGERVAAPGQYLSAGETIFVYDVSFAHASKIGTGETSKTGIGFSCDVRWQSCSEWPQDYQSICRDLCWPFKGNLIFYNCKFTFGFL